MLNVTVKSSYSSNIRHKKKKNQISLGSLCTTRTVSESPKHDFVNSARCTLRHA